MCEHPPKRPECRWQLQLLLWKSSKKRHSVNVARGCPRPGEECFILVHPANGSIGSRLRTSWLPKHEVGFRRLFVQ